MDINDPRKNVADGWGHLIDAETLLRRFVKQAEPGTEEARGLVLAMKSLADDLRKLDKEYDNELSEITEGLE